MRKLTSLLIVLVLAGIASALTVSAGTTVTWGGGRIPDGEAHIYGTWHATGRVDFDDGDTVHVYNGGLVQNDDQTKLPDNDGDTVYLYIHSGGTADFADIQADHDHDGKYNEVHIEACGTLISRDLGRDGGDPRTASWNIVFDAPCDGWDVTIDGNMGTFHGTPEPATVALLGMGSLVLLRKRK